MIKFPKISCPFAAEVCTVVGMALVVTVLRYFDWLFPNDAFQGFLRDLLVALFAVGIGIPTALKVNRTWQRSQDEVRRRQLLESLRRAFEANIGYLRIAHDSMLGSIMATPTFTMDLVALDATASLRHQLLPEPALAEAIDRAHFELQHVNRRLQYQLDRSTSSPSYSGRESITAEVRQDAASSHETVELAKHIDEFLNAGKSGRLSLDQISILNLKFGTISLTVGLTPISQPCPAVVSGGAIAWCKKAIEAIDAAAGH